MSLWSPTANPKEPIVLPVPAITEVAYLLASDIGNDAAADFISSLADTELILEAPQGQGCAVVRENNAIVLGGPSQDVGVTHTGKANVLNANNVEVRLAQQQCAHDVAVEVLIGQQPQHLSSSRPSLGEQASADFA